MIGRRAPIGQFAYQEGASTAMEFVERIRGAVPTRQRSRRALEAAGLRELGSSSPGF
jgi:hypothetical protein